MRTSNTIKNAMASSIMSMVTVIIGFISQKIFVIILGTEYLGLNGLFNNILSILSVAELGFGTAIIYNLYKPVSENDYYKINVLLKFYKKTYRIISFIIFILGIGVLPFLSTIVGNTSIPNVHVLFLLLLIEVVISYLLTYKRSILYANQKNYIINIIHIFYVILLNLLQMIFLIITKEYIIYIILKILFRVIENIVINIVAKKMYNYINDDVNEEIDKETKKDILNKVKGLLLHNIGSAFVQGTDNIIISKIFGIVTAGLYSNYNMIISAINNLITQLFQSVTASIGNLLIETNKEKSYSIYKNMLLINSWIYCIASGCLMCVVNIFMEIWMGKEYLFNNVVISCIVLNFYVQGMRKTNSTFKNAAGIFYEDRYVPIAESAVNIVFSIVLAKIFGLSGIFFGTTISSFVLYFYSYPVLVYKRIFNRNYINFIIDNFKYFIISLFSIGITYIIINYIAITSLIVCLIVKLMLTFIILNIIYLLLFHKSEEFKYYINMIKVVYEKRKKKL